MFAPGVKLKRCSTARDPIMCLFKSPKPVAAPKPPSPEDAAVSRERERTRLAKRQGLMSTLLTGDMEDDAPVARKTLLGQ